MDFPPLSPEPALSPSADSLLAYPELPLEEKRSLEEAVQQRPYDLSLEQIRHLLEVGFPFSGVVSTWLRFYEQVAALCQSHGYIPIHQQQSSLSSWMTYQRRRQKRGQLDPARARALNRLGFVWDPREANWQEHFDDFQRQTQNTQGPIYSTRIRTWLHSMRREAWDRITPRQRQLLSEAGLVRDPRGQSWEKNMRVLEEWQAKNGGLVNLPACQSAFLHEMRKRYARGKLTREQKKRLTRAGVTWKAQGTPVEAGYSSLWEMRYAQARAYIERHAPEVPPLYKWEDHGLFQWIMFQKNRWAKLSEDQRQRLTELNLREPGIARQEAWQKLYRRAQAIYDQYHPKSIGGFGAYNQTVKRWLRKQTEQWASLSPGQQDQLAALGASPAQLQESLERKWQQNLARSQELHARLALMK